MKYITIEEVQKTESLKLIDLAEKTGLNISLLSKIKNANAPITSKTQKQWQKSYPNTILINGFIKWREMYYEQVNINYQLKEENKKLKQDNQAILKAIRSFYNKYEKE